MLKVLEFINNLLDQVFSFAKENPIGKKIIEVLEPFVVGYFKPLWEKLNISFMGYEVAFFIIFNLLILIVLCILLKLIFGRKKKKITFIVDDQVYAKTKAKYKKKIKFPVNPVKEGSDFVGWFTDMGGVNQYPSNKMLSKKALTLYACFDDGVAEAEVDEVKPQVEVEEPTTETAPIAQSVEENQTTCQQVEEINEQPQVEIDFKQPTIQEEKIEHIVDASIGDLYDDLRVEMLSYSRAKAFNDFGLYRKQIVAEMFEKDGVINLYLAIDPALMLEKNYQVEKYTDAQFSIVPCRKAIKNQDDYNEAVALIKETMTLNNLIKTDLINVTRTVSDSKARRSGFAFFVKNDQVATTAVDYYKILRQNVLCYSASTSKEVSRVNDNKMILKIFKKDEEIFVYLALNAEQEGLEFVGYDKNFVDTPAMLKVNTFEDVVTAYYLIDKLMYRYGMEKFPENGESIGTEQIEKNCGFGYRIRH